MIDALPEPGGQVTAMYPEKVIFDVAGFPASRAGTWSPTWSSRPPRSTRDYLLGVRAEKLVLRRTAGRC